VLGGLSALTPAAAKPSAVAPAMTATTAVRIRLSNNVMIQLPASAVRTRITSALVL
jgi:hypothetical protein